MSDRGSMMAWLAAGVGFGFLTLACAGAGGYSAWYADAKTASAEKTYEDENLELARLENRAFKQADVKRFEELNNPKRREANADNVNQWRQYRQYALVFLLSSILPALIAARCLVTAVVRMMKKPAPKPDPEEEVEPKEKKAKKR